jgi:hypothetical protein
MKWFGAAIFAFIIAWYLAAWAAAAYYGAKEAQLTGWRRLIWYVAFWPF